MKSVSKTSAGSRFASAFTLVELLACPPKRAAVFCCSRARRNVAAAREGEVRRGFTLVELLVVVAIIAVLMSLTMPGIRHTLTLARSVQCLSNLRSIVHAQQSYLNDNNFTLPQAQNIEQPVQNKTPGFDELMTWQLQLSAYLGEPAPNHTQLPPILSGCPNFRPVYKTYMNREPIDPSTGRNLVVRSYAMNPHLVLEGKTDPGYATKVGQLNLIMDWYVHPYKGYHPATDVTKPSLRAAFADSNDVWFYAQPGPHSLYTTGRDAGRHKWWDPFRHGQHANYAMHDGHAVSLPPNEGWAALAAPGDNEAYRRDW